MSFLPCPFLPSFFAFLILSFFVSQGASFFLVLPFGHLGPERFAHDAQNWGQVLRSTTKPEVSRTYQLVTVFEKKFDNLDLDKEILHETDQLISEVVCEIKFKQLSQGVNYVC